jgi:hypothetical protein
LVLGIWIVYEAIRRLIEPPEVRGGLVLAIALIGIAVNLAATWVPARANRQNLAVEGSFQYILTDLYAFIATALGRRHPPDRLRPRRRNRLTVRRRLDAARRLLGPGRLVEPSSCDELTGCNVTTIAVRGTTTAR